MPFRDRNEAGRRLAELLESHRGEDAIVLGLPRGGVPVAYEVARTLQLPLDVWVVRKVGVPWHAEVGMGAVAEGGIVYLDEAIIAEVGASQNEVASIVERESRNVEERVRRFRQGQAPPALEGKTVIVVDDGIATGGTVRAALRALRLRRPRSIVLAVPVAPSDTLEMLADEADEVVCVEPRSFMYAIGAFYADFSQTSDEEVARLLALAHSGGDDTTVDASDARG